MDRVLEYLNTGETVAFVGAGVSRELGIPAWPELAAELVSRLPAGLGKRLEDANRLLEKGRYPELCGWIARNTSEEFLYSNCREILKDTGKTGRISDFIARFPFKSVFTTNFDNSLERHFKAAGKAVSIFGNTRAELAAVDIDSLNCLVKLHSDLDHTETIVLTDSQYSKVRAAGDHEYLREFIKSYFYTKQFLIVGYSVSDPDIQLLLEQVAQNIRRVTPIFAILADASPDERVRLKTLFNVEVVSYRNLSGTHSELIRLFEALSAFVIEAPAPRLDRKLDLKRAQSLYLWSKFGLSGDASAAHVDALKSVILSTLSEKKQTLQELQQSVGAIVGLAGPVLSETVVDSIGHLQTNGYVDRGGDHFALSKTAVELTGKATDQHSRLRQSFVDQTRLDLANRWQDASDDEREKAVELVVAVLVEIFNERGVEISNSVLGGAEVGGRRSANLFATLSRAGEALGTDELRYRFVSYLAGVMTNPADAQRAYLEHLVLAFFCLSALAMDPDGHQFRRQFMSGRSILVDSNVLIPLVPLRGTFREDIRDLMALARECGLPLLTTESFIEELYRHGRWASELVRTHGHNSIEVLAAARGEGYGRNTFLDGFVRYCVDEKSIPFDRYLSECIGGLNFTRQNVGQYLEREFGINCFGFATLASKRQSVFAHRDETEEYIRQQAEDRQIDKSDSRIRAEAEAYAIVANWDALVEVSGEPRAETPTRDVAVLSQGGYLNRIAHYGPRPLGRYIVVPPDALYGFLLRAGVTPRSALSFRELMVSPLFDTSAHFVDWERYRRFFSSLINDADRIYRDHLDSLQAEVDASLKPEFFEQVEPLDRPYFASSLQNQLEAKLEQNRMKEMELAAELAESERGRKKAEKQLRNVEAALARKARKKEARQKGRIKG